MRCFMTLPNQRLAELRAQRNALVTEAALAWKDHVEGGSYGRYLDLVRATVRIEATMIALVLE